MIQSTRRKEAFTLILVSHYLVTAQSTASDWSGTISALGGQALDDFGDDGSLGLIQVGAGKLELLVETTGSILQNKSSRPRTLVQAAVGTRGFVPASRWASAEENSPPGSDPILKILNASAPNQTTAADILAVRANAKGDLEALESSLVLNSFLVVFCLSAFAVLRRRFPRVYEGNQIPKHQETSARLKSFAGWIPGCVPSLRETQENMTLDAVMAVRFHTFSVQVAAVVGIPMCLVMCPLHLWCGGKPAGEVDRLSRFGLANVESGSWLYWVHAVVLIIVTVAVEHAIFVAMDHFLVERVRWLKTMPEPRCTTVMIENVPSGPEGHCSDVALKDYFRRLLPDGDIREVHVVRRTDYLMAEKRKLDAAQLMLGQAQAARSSGRRFIVGGCCSLVRVDQEQDYSRQLREAYDNVSAERRRLLDADDKDEWAYSTTAFVTFTSQRHAEIARHLQFTTHADSLVMSIPPDPTDIRWGDLKGDAHRQAVLERIGYLCALGLYIGFMPITVTISSITNLEHIRQQSPLVDRLLAGMPWLEAGLKGVLASFALTLFLSFLPSIFMIIFDNFFVLTANAWAQHKLQIWYFWFQIVFVLLVTIVGGSVVIAFKQIAEQPFAVFGLLADSMPTATHFYLNFMVMQWVTHAIQLTRYITLVKYLALQPVLGESRAKELSEPEDQDYYGFGSRSARWTINMAIMLVFCQISPFICIAALVDFAICRLVFGHLYVFSEDPKPDLGGVFFVQQLKHLQKTMFIYVALMVGVLFRRGHGYGPTVLGLLAMAFLAFRVWKFSIRFETWETLPFEEVVDAERFPKRTSSAASYMQPELDESLLDAGLLELKG